MNQAQQEYWGKGQCPHLAQHLQGVIALHWEMVNIDNQINHNQRQNQVEGDVDGPTYCIGEYPSQAVSSSGCKY